MNSLLLFITFVSVFCINFGYEIPEPLRSSLLALHDHCMEETKASVPILQECINGQIPNDRDAMCYLYCMVSQSTYDLEQRFQWVKEIKHEISHDIHNWKSHVSKECDAKIGELYNISKIIKFKIIILTGHDDKCLEGWQRVNCYLQTHNDTMEYCLLFMFQDKYLK